MSRPVTLVTGGTGFLGTHLVKALVERGERVRVLARGGAPELEGVEIAVGDVLRDPEGAPPLERALDGVDRIYHLAGFVSRSADDGQRMMRVHVDGTRRLFEAAAKAKVRRVLLASTSGTIAVSRDPEPLDETAPYPTELVGNWPYYLSKIYQEKLALALGKKHDIEVVVVNPSLLLGPGDLRGSSTGDVKKFLRKELPIIPPGGVNFVDARDAALGAIAAMDRGLDREPPVDRISVEMSQVFWYCDSQKAERELGFVARDPAETLADTIADLRERQI